ncbi:Lysozyme [Eumeta japonica]|uniref:lysozyme n=1 Tax=Eumeta variegata TaxID=151549 RepID=A0A4C1TS74_EUMVA|nr:Lysozyme [Eumeta japonica]
MDIRIERELESETTIEFTQRNKETCSTSIRVYGHGNLITRRHSVLILIGQSVLNSSQIDQYALCFREHIKLSAPVGVALPDSTGRHGGFNALDAQCKTKKYSAEIQMCMYCRWLLACVALMLVREGSSHARLFTRCQLSRELQRYNFPRSLLPRWVCLIEHASGRSTEKVTNHNNGFTSYGLFQSPSCAGSVYHRPQINAKRERSCRAAPVRDKAACTHPPHAFVRPDRAV